MVAQGFELAVEDFGLTLKAFKLALTGVVGAEECLWDGGLEGGGVWLGPGVRERCWGGLVFEPLQALVEESEAALDGVGELPFPVAVEGGEGGDGLGEAAEVGDEGGYKLGKGAPAGPGLGEQAFERLFGVVVGQAGEAAGVGE